MKEKPALFSGPMVRAIIEGRKTQTRRIVKPQPPYGCVYAINGNWTHAICYKEGPIDANTVWVPPTPRSEDHRLPYPYPVGTRLWVRETWQAIHAYKDSETCQYDDFDYAKEIPNINPPGEFSGRPWWGAVYAADDCWDSHISDRGFPWRPAIHMPRWASRLTLEVVSVRVERLNDISEEDAKAEGVDPYEYGDGMDGAVAYAIRKLGSEPYSYKPSFSFLWDELYKDRGYGWDANPYVWAYTFKVLESTQ